MPILDSYLDGHSFKYDCILKLYMTILVFAAHPDDDVLGTGGTIAKYAKEGKKCVAVICSSGESLLGTHIIKKTVAVETRLNEAIRAGEILGFKETLFLGLKDTKLNVDMANIDVKEKIALIIKKYKPEKIFVHSEDDPHPDHNAVAKTVVEVCKKIKYEGSIYCFDIWNPVDVKKRNLPKMYVDISDTFKLKVRALKAHKSQFFQTLPVLPSMYIKAFI